FCKGHSASYIQVAQHSCYLRAHYPAEFMAAVLANGGGVYYPLAVGARAMRIGFKGVPPRRHAREVPCTPGRRAGRLWAHLVKGLSVEGAERVLKGRGGPFTSLSDLRTRTGLGPPDLRALIKVGALDSIAGGWTRPMMLWRVDETPSTASSPPSLKEYSTDRR